jgi:hypothetical protein
MERAQDTFKRMMQEWGERIGSLLPKGTDLWWPIPAESSTVAIVDEVINAIREYALPEMRRQIQGAPCERLWA